jgi:uncharacterized repeat protein (TIGR01451 family)
MSRFKKVIWLVALLALLASFFSGILVTAEPVSSGTENDGSYNIYVSLPGDWQWQGALDFSDYVTRELTLQHNTGTLQIKIVQHGHDTAYVDYLALSKDGVTYSPVSAVNLNTGADVLAKVLSPEYDVCYAWDSSLVITWDAVPANTTLLMRAVEEDLGAYHGTPFYYPYIHNGEFLKYTLVDDGGMAVDGVLAETGAPDFSVFWQPDSPHPDGYTYGWLHSDNTYLYAAVEVTADNTPDKEDWGALYLQAGSQLKEFRVTPQDTTWGAAGFQYTAKVPYQHRVYEFKIPLSSAGVQTGDEIQYGFGCYGTLIQVITVTLKIIPPVAGSSVSYNGTTRYDGDIFPVWSNASVPILAHPAAGYQFSYWLASPALHVDDTTSAQTQSSALGPGTLIMAQTPATLSPKWLQSPNVLNFGVDVLLEPGYNSQLKDDFICRETGNLTGVTLWGAWSADEIVSANFTLEFRSDTATLWSANFTAGEYQTTLFYSSNYTQELLWDPATDLSWPTHNVYQYDFTFDPATPFYQEKGQIYWLAVKMDYPQGEEDHIFGWKHSLDNWNQDAVWTDPPSYINVDLVYPDYLTWPGSPHISPRGSLDLAFALYGEPAPATAKWHQEPDTSTKGIDVFCPPGETGDFRELADDFLCTETGPITGISLWGSWLENVPSVSTNFTLAILSNVPAYITGDYSVPDSWDDALWHAHFTAGESPGQYQESLYSWGTEELFWDPQYNEYDVDSAVWRYDFAIDPATAFIQQAGHVYWLVVTMDYDTDGGTNFFGWKTSLSHWSDNAVWQDMLHTWRELVYPAGGYFPGAPMDLAFALYGQPGEVSIGDYVWEDSDRDGIQDTGEPGIAGVTVNLFRTDNTLVDTTTTLAGNYGFTGVAPGDYYVQFILPAGYVFVPGDQGPNDALDSDADPSTGNTAIFTLAAGQSDTSWDAGMYLAPGIKWLQEPDLTSQGIDVLSQVIVEGYTAVGGVVLADDFQCIATGNITNIRVWGSWLGDNIDPDRLFLLDIVPDIPATSGNFSRPDLESDDQWVQFFYPGDYQAQLYANSNETFFKTDYPNEPAMDTQVWQYDFYLDPENPFYQTYGTTYWLAVISFPMTLEGQNKFFGWKTSATHWNDDAVVIPFTIGTVEPEISELRYPWFSPQAGQSIDLAFALYGPAPDIVDPKTVERIIDADGNGVTSPGDTLRYTCVIENTGSGNATDVTFFDTPDINATLVVGSVTTDPPVAPADIIKGNTAGDIEVEVDLGAIPASGNATVTFDVRIKNPTNATQIANQALVEGSDFPPVLSDDPATGTPNDPTIIRVQSTPPPVQSIGGQVEPVNRLSILMPWVALVSGLALIVFLGIRVARRHRVR